ncbi:MAG: sodium-dependent transporter [Planctomycetota bacterium]|nr:MAG: sodium-dependent transporter [Planctomycetota bacterium]
MSERAAFSSRWGLILAALGMAVGTGNVWRFPRVLSQNGGGTFLIPWAIFLFTWSIPLLMAEFALGRAAGRGPVGAFARIFGRNTAWRGGFVAFCTIAIMFYYSVVAGWTARYVWLAVGSGFSDLGADGGLALFTDFTHTSGPALAHLVSIGLACAVVAAGVTKGIERSAKLLVPTLFVVLIISLVRGVTLEGAGEGIRFLTTVDWARLGDYRLWLEALSQSAWSTGAGWGLMIGYSVYATNSMRAGRECVVTGVGNNLASLLAAFAIIPAVFALAPMAGQDPAQLVEQSGPGSTGLTFVWIPVLYQQMPWGGGALSILFFVALFFAALSSLIAMVELAVRTLLDLGWQRRRAVAAVFVGGFALGLPSAIDLPFIEGHDGFAVFQNQDWVWGVGLIVSGAITGWAVLRYGVSRFYAEFIAGPEGGSTGGFTAGLFRWSITLLIPVQAVGLLGWWFWQAWTWTEAPTNEPARSIAERLGEWLDPSSLFSVGTCLAQWAVVLLVLRLVNRRLGRAADG